MDPGRMSYVTRDFLYCLFFPYLSLINCFFSLHRGTHPYLWCYINPHFFKTPQALGLCSTLLLLFTPLFQVCWKTIQSNVAVYVTFLAPQNPPYHVDILYSVFYIDLFNYFLHVSLIHPHNHLGVLSLLTSAGCLENYHLFLQAHSGSVYI